MAPSLLESFPAPPFHNPPPSLPPSTPLPPVPGPSPLETHDPILFLSRRRFSNRPNAPSPSPPSPQPTPSSSSPSSSSPPLLSQPPRTPSPDISHILSTTPRPRRRTAQPHPTSPYRRRTIHTATSYHKRGGLGADEEGRLLWEDESEEDPVDPVLDSKLEKELDGNESDSDSSLDLHTPLPDFMVRHGFLSPHSKLLPPPADPRASVFSIDTNISVVTKSGIIKDERDTPKRRDRHRDGQLLRGGVGLTTGLGWSDSEDEDAPSPLTRRLSSLTLSRRSTMSPMNASTNRLSSSVNSRKISTSSRTKPTIPSSLSRSFSGTSLRSEQETDQLSIELDEFGRKPRLSMTSSTFPPPTPTPSSITRRRPASDTRASGHHAGELGTLTPRRMTMTTGDRSPLRLSYITNEGGERSPEKKLPPLPRPVLRKRPSKSDLKSEARQGLTIDDLSTSIPKKSRPLLVNGNSSQPHLASPHRPQTQPSSPAISPRISAVYSGTALNGHGSGLAVPPPASPGLKPRPRTGTGMVYRTSGHGNGGRLIMKSGSGVA